MPQQAKRAPVAAEPAAAPAHRGAEGRSSSAGERQVTLPLHCRHSVHGSCIHANACLPFWRHILDSCAHVHIVDVVCTHVPTVCSVQSCVLQPATQPVAPLPPRTTAPVQTTYHVPSVPARRPVAPYRPLLATAKPQQVMPLYLVRRTFTSSKHCKLRHGRSCGQPCQRLLAVIMPDTAPLVLQTCHMCSILLCTDTGRSA